MDAKFLAKSKRAHTQHLNKKHHPKPTSKAPSAGVGVGGTSSQKPNVKQFKGSKKLPSNWDRYEDEDDLDSQGMGQGSKSQVTDGVVPKSKGADYAYLISEAKAQAELSCPSFDDVFSDFRQEVGSLLTVRGENILSWASEDDFLSEDKASGFQEASFLSMDLNALAEQLAKVDLSERLFIGADLLPLVLSTEELQTRGDHKSCMSEIPIVSETTNKISSELSGGANQSDWDIEVQGTSDFDHPVKSELFVSKSRSDESFMPESKRQLSNEPALVQNKSQSGFKAADAEAELDMLLDSFSEPNVPQSTLLKEESRYSTSTILSEETTSDQLVCARMKNSLDQSNAASTLDDSLDDLLMETSNRINQDIVSRSNVVKTASPDCHPSSSGPTKSKLLDDFDSWLDTI
ncbi:Large tegument protein like [Heracleum sosnowskyi]|uniref:Large tegument protein like n=1 Tax=Heracleum sosnowskyi TaxID=360622 RepID=A0AAD8IWQ0_9APIA|nr:Large tegument protein like [Heracleum sosnowskyi]